MNLILIILKKELKNLIVKYLQILNEKLIIYTKDKIQNKNLDPKYRMYLSTLENLQKSTKFII